MGIPFEGKTGPYNAITDVPGVAVGHSTIIKGEGTLVPGVGPIRTGVTAILPRPRGNWDFVMAATFNQNGSGDLFLAFSTANPGASKEDALATLEMVPNDAIDPFFRATIAATEEAVVNAMLAAPPTFTGVDGLRISGLPGDRLVAAMKKYGRMK